MPIINFSNVTKVMHNTQPIQKIYAGAVLVWEKPKKRVTQDFYTFFTITNTKKDGKTLMYVGNNLFEQAPEFVVGVITPYNGEFRLKLGALWNSYIEVVSCVSLSGQHLSGQQLSRFRSGRHQLIYEI